MTIKNTHKQSSIGLKLQLYLLYIEKIINIMDVVTAIILLHSAYFDLNDSIYLYFDTKTPK